MPDCYRTPLKQGLLSIAVLGAIAACVAAPIQQGEIPPVALAAEQPVIDATSRVSFTGWLEQFRIQAQSQGIAAWLLERELSGLTLDQAVIRADQSQPEFSRPVWEYLDSALSHHRVSTGRILLQDHARTLSRIERRYGVDRHILVAIWGLESSYGRVLGDRSIIRSLATLAYDGRRPEFARNQLIAALKILQAGDVPPSHLKGSWAGAMGQTQFIPTTYLDYAVDFDGDGHRNLVDSTADALASTANYLQASDWQPGQSWGFEVRLPAGFDYQLADPEIRKSLASWRQLGVRGIPASQTARTPATLLLPAGHKGPAFLTLGNFQSILHYNNSTAYALAIGLLSERLQGKGGVQGSWPDHEQPLSRTQRLEMQERLRDQGFDPGIPDGIIGANTRRAIRAYQQSQRLPADGYPTQELLMRLRLSAHAASR